MSKLACHVAFPLMADLFLVAAALTLGGCTATGGEGFALYLTKADVPPAQMSNVSRIKLAEQPLIASADIVTYNAQTHELKLRAGAYERIARLEVPVNGRSFVVCVDGAPVYGGAFWTPISSLSYDGITIWKPFTSTDRCVVTLQLGYSTPSFYGDTDHRNDPVVLRSLELAGKLVTRLSIRDVESLPQSMKGYELYSWSQDGRWHFALMTGTNRNKTLEEVISSEDIVSEAGEVRIHVVGVNAAKAALGKLRTGEEVFWLAQPRTWNQSRLAALASYFPLSQPLIASEHTAGSMAWT